MIESVFRSDDLPTEDRFDGWREYKRKMLAPLAASSSHSSDYQAYLRLLHLGDITVSSASFRPTVLRRTPKLIRLSDPEMYHLTLVVHGTARTSHEHGDFTYQRYDIAIRSSSRPHTIWTDSDRGGFSQLGVNIPDALLPLPREKIDQLVGQPLSGRTGIGTLLAGFLTRLTRESRACRASDGPRLGAVAADLVSSLFAHTLDVDRALPAETHRRVLILRIRAFIEQHLCDPGLSPATIAEAHHISLSQLHRLFDLDGMSVMTWIRRQRLERARQDLADPALRAMPVHVIAARWGFSRHSVFTRAFRDTYGLSPTEHRREVATGSGPW